MNQKQKFIRKLIDELNNINENGLENDKQSLDVCFMTSIVDQKIEKCKDFKKELDLGRWCINGYEKDHSHGYTNGKVRILIEKPDEEKESDYMVDTYENYCYYIEFLYDNRDWGYCACTSNMTDYDERYGCCGHGCDWTAPACNITKEYNIGHYEWEGDEHEYWDYKDKFNQNKSNKQCKQKELLIQQKSIQLRIEELSKELVDVKHQLVNNNK